MDARIIPDQVGDRRPGITKIFSRRDCVRVVQESFASKMRAQGMPGARRTRSLAWGKNKNHTSIVTTVTAGFTRHPLRNGFNGFLRALLGDRACLPPSPPRSFASRELDASVGASGPHDFAVRTRLRQRLRRRLTASPPKLWRRRKARVRPSRALRPSHPVPNVRDDRETPLLMRTGRGRYSGDLRFGKTEIFLLRGLDKGKTVEQACGDLPVGLTSLSLFQWRKS
jgi:hypothetical protein